MLSVQQQQQQQQLQLLTRGRADGTGARLLRDTHGIKPKHQSNQLNPDSTILEHLSGPILFPLCCTEPGTEHALSVLLMNTGTLASSTVGVVPCDKRATCQKPHGCLSRSASLRAATAHLCDGS
jgi:hypothetical protein